MLAKQVAVRAMDGSLKTVELGTPADIILGGNRGQVLTKRSDQDGELVWAEPVQDGSVTAEKLADGAVSVQKLGSDVPIGGGGPKIIGSVNFNKYTTDQFAEGYQDIKIHSVKLTGSFVTVDHYDDIREIGDYILSHFNDSEKMCNSRVLLQKRDTNALPVILCPAEYIYEYGVINYQAICVYTYNNESGNAGDPKTVRAIQYKLYISVDTNNKKISEVTIERTPIGQMEGITPKTIR